MIVSMKKREFDNSEQSLEDIIDSKAFYPIRSGLEETAKNDERSLSLSHGRKVIIKSEGECLQITSETGVVELTVKITENGPVLTFEEANIEIVNKGDLKLECENLDIKTRGKMKVDTGDDIEYRVSGNLKFDVRDDAQFSAQSMEIKSELGDLSLIANDDVAINGLRILMNVPDEEELAKKRKDARSVADLLKIPFRIPGAPVRLPRSKPKERKDW